MNRDTDTDMDLDTTSPTAEGATITAIAVVAAITAIGPIAMVGWEPCSEFQADESADADAGVCRACGWSSDEHELATAA